MQLTFMAKRNPRNFQDDITARHVCSARTNVMTLIRMWYRLAGENEVQWRLYQDENHDDYYCPRCGHEYPDNDEIERQYQQFRAVQFEHEVREVEQEPTYWSPNSME